MPGRTVDDLMVSDAGFGQGQRHREDWQLDHPRDVANRALFLALDESTRINGQRFVIDNGDIIQVPSAS